MQGQGDSVRRLVIGITGITVWVFWGYKYTYHVPLIRQVTDQEGFGIQEFGTWEAKPHFKLRALAWAAVKFNQGTIIQKPDYVLCIHVMIA